MATLRLFARLRELAGSSRLDVAGSTVGEVLETAADRFGDEFTAALATARVWRNGEEAALSDPIGVEDEVAVLPPVSGGATTMVATSQVSAAAPWVVAVVLVLVNMRGDSAWWAAALVAAAGLWVIDVANQMELRGRSMPAVAVVIGSVAGAVLTQSIGPLGLAVAVAVAVMVVLAWGVGLAGHRSVDAVAPGVMVAMLMAAAVGSLVLTRSEASPDPQAIDVFLLVVIVSTALGALVDRLADLPYLDPFTATALAAIGGALVMAVVWDLDVAGYLLVGLGLAVTLVAGRGLGSLLRTGTVALTGQVPGVLRGLDAAMLAAAFYFSWIRLIL